MSSSHVNIARLKTPGALRDVVAQLGLELPVDDKILTASQGSPLADPAWFGSRHVGNRWCIHPMEGWDTNPDGSPSELTLRRWANFGRSGAKLIWGGEASAVEPSGRANPRQTLATPSNRPGLQQLLNCLFEAHDHQFATTDDLVVGLQLTHSGRFARPNSQTLEPRIAYHHPLLDEKYAIDPANEKVVLTDTELERLIERYVEAAGVARDVGFHFVDVKACHGYLIHELLSARCRPGPFGGDYEGRTRFLKTIIQRIHQAYPDLMVAVRLSVYDFPPFCRGPSAGEPMTYAPLLPYTLAFGASESDPMTVDLAEPIRLIRELAELGVVAVNVTCGSPYYNPHIQRPAHFPPSDGYPPPEDPLIGVDRLVRAARACKDAVPSMPLVGTGYTYLQDYVPHVAQAVVRQGWIDFVGLGRMVLSYPEFPADCLQRGILSRKRICRTFSDCTTAPRNGMVSGCFPLDPHYKVLSEAGKLKELKKKLHGEYG